MGLEFKGCPLVKTSDSERMLAEIKLTCDGCGKSESIWEKVSTEVIHFGARQGVADHIQEMLGKMLKKAPKGWCCGSMTGSFRYVNQDEDEKKNFEGLKDLRNPNAILTGLFFGCCEEHLAAVMLRAVGIAKVAEKLL